GAPVAAGPTATTLFALADHPAGQGIRLPVVIRAGVALQRRGLLDAGWRGTDPGSLLQALGPARADPRVLPAVVGALGLDR
ncbi:hypothetical protein ABK046_51160, partial [Streptomyces caeruleatus]